MWTMLQKRAARAANLARVLSVCALVGSASFVGCGGTDGGLLDPGSKAGDGPVASGGRSGAATGGSSVNGGSSANGGSSVNGGSPANGGSSGNGGRGGADDPTSTAGAGGAPVDGTGGSGNPGGAGGEDSAGAGQGGAPTTPPLLHVDTQARAHVTAGDQILVTCLLLDDQGDAQMPEAGVEPSVSFEPEDSVQIAANGEVTAVRAGTVAATCSFSALALSDGTPATIDIAAGPAASVVTTLDASQITAGGTVNASCEVSDAFGNVLTDADPSLSLAPEATGNRTRALSATLTIAGDYTLACSVPGAIGTGAPLLVVPGLPAAITLSRAPEAPSYPLGSIVQAVASVSDELGNIVPNAAVAYVSNPAASANPGGDQFFQYSLGGDGFSITGTVTGPTKGGVVLSATTGPFDVEGTGPTVTCGSPLDGSMLNAAPGSSVNFQGSWQGVNAVTSVTVNGENVTPSNGQFSKPLSTRFGLNFARVVVTDKFGKQARKVCSFLIANQWAAATALYSDTISLKLSQAAIDDGNRQNGLNSFADILYGVANSQALAQSIDTAFKASNPLKASACDSQTCTFLGCVCWYRTGVTYKALSLPGPQTVTLTLVDGGLQASAHFANVALSLQVAGDVGPVPFDTTGWVTYATVDVSLILDQTLSAGKPHISIRPNSVTSSISTASLDFTGVDGWIINNVVVPMANGSIANLLKSTIQSYVGNSFNSVLDGVVSGLDISTLGSTFNVPKLDGTGNLAISFSVGFSSLSGNSSRALYGIGTRFSGPLANARSSLGIAIPTGTVLDDPSLAAPASTAVSDHIGIYNQLLHALWRANLFDATLSATQLGSGTPDGVQVKVSSTLPPIANLVGSTTELSMGGLPVDIAYPGLFAAQAPLHGALAARVTMPSALVGNDLVFSTPTISEFYFEPGTPLTDAERTSIETVLHALVLKLADASLNQSLPALPIPTFAMPASVAQFGLPSGGRLGTVGPSLGYDPRSFVLRGGFGLR